MCIIFNFDRINKKYINIFNSKLFHAVVFLNVYYFSILHLHIILLLFILVEQEQEYLKCLGMYNYCDLINIYIIRVSWSKALIKNKNVE